MTGTLNISFVNSYLAHKQHLLPASRLADVVQVTRDIVALHATAPTGPYLSLWARVPDFQRQGLDDALYERRELARVHCMRMTVHAVPSEERCPSSSRPTSSATPWPSSEAGSPFSCRQGCARRGKQRPC